jgi:probable tail fiber protein
MKTLLPEINSADKRFHAGNPATGEQGTRVTDTWLNDVQDRVRDMQAEAHYVLEKAGFTPKQEQQTQLYQAIVKIIDDNRKKASTTQKGEVQLYSGYDSDSEELAATPKVIKTLKGFIDSITRSLTNYIPNSKKSSAVNSNSNDTVATSAAVKTAYDKGVDANSNANGRVSKNGDTMTGALTVPHIIVNDQTNNDNSVQVGDDAKFLDIDHAHSIGLQSLGDSSKGYIAYGAAKKKFGFDGYRFLAESSIFTAQYGHGSYASQYTSNAPYMVEESGSIDRDAYHPFIKGRVRKAGTYGAAFSFGYTTRQGQGDGFGRGIIHLIEDNGANRLWSFEHNGDFYSAGDVITSNGKSLNTAAQLSDFQYQKIGDFEIRRYPDGMMIQTYFTEFNDIHASSLGFGGTGQKQLTWAVSFVGKPMVFGNITTSLNDHHDVGVNILTKSTNTTLYWYNYEHSNPNQGLCRLQFLAVGRWK